MFSRFIDQLISFRRSFQACLVIGVACFLFNGTSQAGEASLAWDPVVDPNLGGYKLVYGLSSRDYSASVDVGNTTSYTVSGLQGGARYYFAVKVYNLDRTAESDLSNEVNMTVPVPVPITVDFDANPTSGDAPLVVNFTDASTGDITNWYWDFGDGSTSTAPHAMKSYGSAGTYTVSLTVTGPNGTATETKTNLITVTDPPLPPIANFTASPTFGVAPLIVDFADSSIGSFNSWSWDFGDGTTSTAQSPVHTYSTAGNYTVSLSVTGQEGRDAETKTGYITVSSGVPGGGDPSHIFEVGSVTLTDAWSQVTFEQQFTDPIVVTGSLSYNGKEPAVVRIRNLSSSGFEIRIQEWEYLNDRHSSETLNYLVMERGNYTLEDGTRVAAGSFEPVKTGSFETIKFVQDFPIVPIVFTSLSSMNDSATVTTRIRNISVDSFQAKMQEQEASFQDHGMETISYVAWEPAMGILASRDFEVNRTANKVRHKPYRIPFQQNFVDAPIVLIAMQTTDGGDTANLRWSENDQLSVSVKATEEQSKDSETKHTSEVVGYMVFSR